MSHSTTQAVYDDEHTVTQRKATNCTAVARWCLQVAGLGKQIVRSELRARDVALQAEAAEAAACRKDMERLAQVGTTAKRINASLD